MKRNILYLILMAIIASCNNNGRIHKKLNDIKEVGDSDPILAKVMLDSLKVEVRSSSMRTQMAYDLLRIRLDDKADIVPTSDIVIKDVLDYYIKNGNEREKQEAYYYAGSTYRDLNDYPRSMEYFLTSCKYAEQSESCDSIMLRNTYSNLSFVYNNVQDYANDLLYAKKEYSIEKQLGKVSAVSLTHIAQAYLRTDSIDNAKTYFKLAFELTQKAGQKTKRNMLFPLLSDLSVLEMHEAFECYENIKALNIKDLLCYEYTALAHYFEYAGNIDTAIVCNKYILEHSEDVLDLYDASLHLFHIYQKKGDAVTANLYAQKVVDINERYNMNERQELAVTINNRFQYHRNKEEERQIKEARDGYMFLAIISCMSFLLLIAVFATFYTHKRNKHLKRAMAMANEINAVRADNAEMTERLHQMKEDLSTSMQNLHEAKDKLSNVNEELEKYNRELKEKEKQLEGKIEQNKSLIRMLSLSETESAAEEIIARIRKASDGQYAMKPKDWRGLYNAVDELYPDFRDSIARNLGNFSEQEMQVCYLMRAGLDNRHIQNVMPMSRATIWRWTKRMHWISRP